MQGTQVEPWSRKIPHAAEQLSPRAATTESPRATTTEARAPRARAPQQEKPPQGEACPRSTQPEKARMQQQTPNVVKNK